MGIIGFGRIGRQTVAIARAFGMHVVSTATAQRDEVLAMSDVLSLHCPLAADNAGMINTAALARMKRSAFLINTARGSLIVEQDLADALNQGVIAGAGLDVLSAEPPPAGNPLFTARNCFITPHIARATKEARQRLLGTGVDNLRSYLAGQTQNAV